MELGIINFVNHTIISTYNQYKNIISEIVYIMFFVLNLQNLMYFVIVIALLNLDAEFSSETFYFYVDFIKFTAEKIYPPIQVFPTQFNIF